MFSILIRFPSLNICLTYSPMGTGCFRRAHEVKPHHGISQRLHGFLDGCFGSSFSRSGCSSSGPRELFSARSRESWRCKSMQAGERTHLTDYLVLLITKLQLIRGQHNDIIINSQNSLRLNFIIREETVTQLVFSSPHNF